jgi:hypothetical protein
MEVLWAFVPKWLREPVPKLVNDGWLSPISAR